jgi:anti-sigma B factor antagonist
MGERQPGPGIAGSDLSEFLETAISHPRPGTVVLTVSGEIDTLTAPPFTAAADELVASEGEALVIDLSGVRFLASSGLAVLISAAHRAEERGLRLQLVVSSRAVRRPLEITGTAELFDLHPDLGSATGGAIEPR